MALHNTHSSFGSVAKLLHWVVAVLFLATYCVVYGKHWFTEEDSPASMTLLQVHQIIGFSIMVFAVVRVAWRLLNVQPAPVPNWTRLGARFAHAALYFFMVAMPISGYLYAKNATDVFGLWTIPTFADTAAADWLVSTWDLTLKEGIRDPVRTFHREIAGELLLWILILVHVAAALYHHFVARDQVLLRMLPNALGSKAGREN